MPLQSFTGSFGSQLESVQRSNVAYSSTTIVANASAGTFTATPVQFVASTPFDVTWLRIINTATCANSNARNDVMIDIMVGGAGSETSIATFLFGARPANSSYTIPIYIPSGSRISGRTAAGVGSRSLTWALELRGGPSRDLGGLPSRWIMYGQTASTAYGTAITYGSTNAWGSWTALTTSTTYAHDLWLPMLGSGTATTITAVNYRTQFAVASTTDAATMVTNSTGVFEAPMLLGATSETIGALGSAGQFNIGLDDIIYAPRASGTAASVRGMCSGTPVASAVTCAILAAVK